MQLWGNIRSQSIYHIVMELYFTYLSSHSFMHESIQAQSKLGTEYTKCFKTQTLPLNRVH